MTRPRRTRRTASPAQRVPRTARLNELLREIVADELTSIDDERLEQVSVTAVDADSELQRAIVFFDSLAGPDHDGEVLVALGSHRVRLQRAIGDQMRARRTPILEFRPDEVIRAAERIEQILRDAPPVQRADAAIDTDTDTEQDTAQDAAAGADVEDGDRSA